MVYVGKICGFRDMVTLGKKDKASRCDRNTCENVFLFAAIIKERVA